MYESPIASASISVANKFRQCAARAIPSIAPWRRKTENARLSIQMKWPERFSGGFTLSGSGKGGGGAHIGGGSLGRHDNREL